MNLKEYSVEELLSHLPDAEIIGSFQSFHNKRFDFYLTALGFEERTLSIPEQLAISSDSGFTCDECIYFTYATSTTDNAFNEPRLQSALEAIKKKSGESAVITNMFCDEDGFYNLLHQKLANKIEQSNREISIIIDLSVCSSKLILSLTKLLFDIRRINLTVLYTEASIYYPLYEEFIKQKEMFLNDSPFSMTSGYEDIINSNEFSEGAKESSDLVIAFAPFKVGRINKIVSDIDESILLNNDNRLIWIVGHPNFSEHEDCIKRIEMTKEINGIDEFSVVYDVPTISYKATIQKLEEIYRSNPQFHINIADLGSKMQTMGISLFYHFRPDVSVYYALPRVYNSNRYSAGVKQYWRIEFGLFQDIVDTMNMTDQLEIIFQNPNDATFFE